ncbi:hypothetical protein Tco_0484935 [Tanacetum coccineum]
MSTIPPLDIQTSIRCRLIKELTKQEQLQYDCDVPATNIVLQGLPPDVCIPLSIIFNQLKISEIESSYSCKALNCHIKNVNQVQVNTKFLNALQPKWSKFVTDVKLAKNMYSTNYGQLYAYHSQHEGHANEARMLRERYLDPLALVANYQTQSNYVMYPQQLSSIPQTTYSSQPYLPTYEAPHHPQQYQKGFQTQLSHTPPLVPQNAYHSPVISPQPQTEFPQLDSGLIVLVFLPGVDPIACLNKAMPFMSTIVASRFLSTNNQLKTSSNLRNQATIQDGRGETMQLVKKGLLSVITVKVKGIWQGSALNQKGQGILHGSRKRCCWFKNRNLNAAFQTDDLDACDSDYDDISLAKVVLMAYLSSYDSDVLSEVNQETQNVNESLTAELERYKERVKTFEQRLNVDLSSHKKLIDSQMDEMIQYRNALKQESDSLKQTLSKQVKEKESLLQTFTVLKKESKKKENNYIDKEINLEKKIKELNNIVYKVG